MSGGAQGGPGGLSLRPCGRCRRPRASFGAGRGLDTVFGGCGLNTHTPHPTDIPPAPHTHTPFPGEAVAQVAPISDPSGERFAYVCKSSSCGTRSPKTYTKSGPTLVGGALNMLPISLVFGSILALGWLYFAFILAPFWLHFGTRGPGDPGGPRVHGAGSKE